MAITSGKRIADSLVRAWLLALGSCTRGERGDHRRVSDHHALAQRRDCCDGGGASALDLINAFLVAPEYRARFLP